MVEFSGFLQTISQTDEEEFEGRAMVLSSIPQWEEDQWFDMCESHDARFKDLDYRKGLKERADEISGERLKVNYTLIEVMNTLLETIGDNKSLFWGLKRIDYDNHELELEIEGLRYIISIKSKNGFEGLE